MLSENSNRIQISPGRLLLMYCRIYILCLWFTNINLRHLLDKGYITQPTQIKFIFIRIKNWSISIRWQDWEMWLNFGKTNTVLEKYLKTTSTRWSLNISQRCVFFLQILWDCPDVCSICETFKSIRTCFVHSALRHMNWIASLILKFYERWLYLLKQPKIILSRHFI
jgi:hypothetical protein